MSLTVTNNRGFINTRGGAVCKAQQRQADFTNLSSPDSVHDWGEVKDSKFKDKTVLTPLYNEANEKVATEQGVRDIGFTCFFHQRINLFNGIAISENHLRKIIFLTDFRS